MASLRKKLVIIGDGTTGKTSLVIKFVNNTFPEDYVPTVFETTVKDVNFENSAVSLEICDTSGQEDYDRLRPLVYPGTNVVLICFSVILPSSYENIPLRWMQEVKHHCSGVPIILVGCQSDLRFDEKSIEKLRQREIAPIKKSEGHDLKAKIGALCYMECSAKTGEGVKEIFEEAVRLAMTFKPNSRGRKNKGCLLL